jgi:hypothetical protein
MPRSRKRSACTCRKRGLGPDGHQGGGQRAFKIEAARLVPNAVEAESMSAVPDLEEPWSPMEAEKAFLAARRVRSVIGAFL